MFGEYSDEDATPLAYNETPQGEETPRQEVDTFEANAESQQETPTSANRTNRKREESTSSENTEMRVENVARDQAYQEELDAKLYRNPEGGKVGLINLGNTCFMNASLQALMHCPPVVGMFLTGRSDLVRSATTKMFQQRKAKYMLVEHFHILMRKIWSGKYSLYGPRDIFRCMIALNPSFRGYGQQDSQEFIRCLLTSMHEALMIKCEYEHLKTSNNAITLKSCTDPKCDKEQKQNRKRIHEEVSVLADLFEGRLRSDVKCSNCGNVSTVKESFMDLSLEIPKDPHLKKVGEERGEDSVVPVQQSFFSSLTTMIGLTSTPLKLETLLHSFCTSSDLKHQNQYRCDKCKQKVDANKVLSITKLPEILCIHIKRFSYSFYGSKVGRSIMFELNNLDMTPYLHSSLKDKIRRQATYDLYGVVRHSGGLSGGHYVGYAKHHITGHWYMFNDRLASRVTPESVAAQQAYVLMYVRKPDLPLRKTINQDLNALENEQWNRNQHPGYVLSRYWIRKCKYLSHPGPIDNRFLCCQHGVPLQNLVKSPGSAVSMSPKRWKALHNKFGGGPIIRADFKANCHKCEIERIRAQEKKIILNLENSWQKTGRPTVWHIISESWMKSWRRFILNGGPRPGPISNDSLFDEHGRPKKNLKSVVDYRGLYKPVWDKLKEMYGGPPSTLRQKIDIYAPEVHPGEKEEIEVDGVVEDADLDPTRQGNLEYS